MKINLIPLILKNIIAPHGVTDMSHAIMTNNNKKLFLINLFNVGVVETVVHPLNLFIEYDIIFFIATIIHFQNDFSNIKFNDIVFPKYISSTIFVISCLVLNNIIPFNLGYDILLSYMTLIHVPNHYRENWFHIKKDIALNFLLLLFTCAFFNSVYDLYPDLLNNNHIINVGKSIIISHIFYQEKYIKNKNII